MAEQKYVDDTGTGRARFFRRYDLLGSMNQASNPYMMPDEDFVYSLNISQEEFGSVQKDGGFSGLGTMQSGSGYAETGFDYIQNDGTHILLAITNGDLQKYTGSPLAWSNVDTGILTATEMASFANFLDRAYIATPSTNLLYTDASTVTETVDVDNGVDIGASDSQFDITNPSGDTIRYTWDTTGTDPDIDGNMQAGDYIYINGTNMDSSNEGKFLVDAVSTNYFDVTNASGTAESNKTIGSGQMTVFQKLNPRYLAVMEQVMYASGFDGNVYDESIVLYTEVGSHIFHKSDETFRTTTNKIRIDGQVKGLYVFRGLVFIFTEEALWYHNPSSLETKIIYRHGTTSHWSVKELLGNMIWADREGIHLFDGDNMPQMISKKLRNRNINSVWNSIDGDSWGSLRAGILDDKYLLYIGDMANHLPGDNPAIGDSTTQFDISNPTGTTFRYTWDDTGTDPDILNTILVGDILVIAGQNFNVNNNGTFTVTAVDGTNNYFEITNASGVAETDKTLGTGSITHQKLQDVVMVFDYSNEVFYLLDQHPVSSFTNYVDSNGDLQLLFTSKDARLMYQRDYSYSHNGTAIRMVLRTRYYEMGAPEYDKSYQRLLVSTRPQNKDDKFLVIRTAVNGSNSYKTKIYSGSTSKIELDGATSQSHIIERVDIGNTRGHNISYEFSNADNTVNPVLLGFTQEYIRDQINLNVST